MTIIVVSEILTWVSLTIALVAAYLWLKASKIEVRRGDPRSRGGVTINDIEFMTTAREQSRWNSWAATVTAIAILVQASSQAIFLLSGQTP